MAQIRGEHLLLPRRGHLATRGLRESIFPSMTEAWHLIVGGAFGASNRIYERHNLQGFNNTLRSPSSTSQRCTGALDTLIRYAPRRTWVSHPASRTRHWRGLMAA